MGDASPAWSSGNPVNIPNDDEEYAFDDLECVSAASPVLQRETTLTKVPVEALRSLRFQDPSLLRGAPVSSVLRHRARILADRPVKEKHYLASAPVDHLDAFISHNWSTPRDDQFLALALHFNLVPAMVVASLVSVAAGTMQVYQVLPSTEEVFAGKAVRVGIWCQILGMMTFMLMLVWGHAIQGFLPWKEPVVFLDKLCVHQTDMSLKRKGIEHLPAFLNYSWRMVVLYSDLYLQKLWTVYELATFLLLFPEGCLHVVPISFPRAAIGLMLLICLSRLLFAIFYLPTTQRYFDEHIEARIDHDMALNLLTAVIFVPIFFVVTLVCRFWARTQACIYARVRSFSITQAACLNEDDRRLVEGNVAAFSRHFGLVKSGARDEETLAVFDALVREEVPRLMASSMGHVGFPYRHAVMMFAVYLPYSVDTMAGDSLDGSLELREFINTALWSVLLVFGIGPLVVALCYVLSKRFLDMKGMAGAVAFVAVVVVTFTAYGFGTLFVANQLYANSRDSWPVLAGNGLFTAALVFVTSRVYSRSKTTRTRRRLAKKRSLSCLDGVSGGAGEGQGRGGDARLQEDGGGTSSSDCSSSEEETSITQV